ncbi:MAG: 1-acyl-sn-glycerol-3-phosphate acyltransferase [Pirellulaceae bacterium]|nr:1-acyl-sn-glycerol-3-phosphate acyltransferase [Pirellulaceae bacterium]
MTLLAAVIWLSLLLMAAIIYMLSQIRGSPYSMWENVLYTPTYLCGRLLWRVHFTNPPPEAMQGGGVLVANHRSSVDPFFVQLSAGRRVHWMVAREYCENGVLGPLLRALQVIPTNRSGMDTGATKQAIRLAREGRLVGMFPEGRLNHTRGPLVSIRPGAALVAVRAGVPLIPLYILGSPYRREVWSPLFMPARVRITFGQPIDPRGSLEHNAVDVTQVEENPEPSPDAQTRTDLAEAERMMLEWGKQIVCLAGRPEWPVEIAGRSRLTTRKSSQ